MPRLLIAVGFITVKYQKLLNYYMTTKKYSIYSLVFCCQ